MAVAGWSVVVAPHGPGLGGLGIAMKPLGHRGGVASGYWSAVGRGGVGKLPEVAVKGKMRIR